MNNCSVMILFYEKSIYVCYNSIKNNPIIEIKDNPSYSAFSTEIWDKYILTNKSLTLSKEATGIGGLFVLTRDYIIFDLQIKKDAEECITKLLKYYRKDEQ